MDALSELLIALTDIIAQAIQERQRAGYFAALYRQVTLEVARRIEDGRFEDGPRMTRFATIFGNRYVDAYHGFIAGQAISEAWRIAFANAAAGKLIILQDLVLGINAHINLDLSVAAATVGLESLRADFLQLNDVIASRIDPAEDVVDKFSPLIRVLDAVGGRTDEEIVNFSIVAAREDAWLGAVLLSATPPDHRPAAIQSLDRRAALVGRRVAEPGFPFSLAIDAIRLKESSDVTAIIQALNIPS